MAGERTERRSTTRGPYLDSWVRSGDLGPARLPQGPLRGRRKWRRCTMFRRLLLVLMVGVLALGFGQAIADPPPPGANGNGNGNGQLKFKDKITPPEQKAAADLFQEQFQAAVAEGAVTA